MESVNFDFMKRTAGFLGLVGLGIVSAVSSKSGIAMGQPSTTRAEAVAHDADPDRPIPPPREATSGPEGATPSLRSSGLTEPWSTGESSPKIPTPAVLPSKVVAQTTADSPIARLVADQPEWACEYQAHVMTEKHVLVGCNDGLVLTLARTPTGVQLIGTRQVNGTVKDFYEQGGTVWVRVVSERAESIVPGSILARGGHSETKPVKPTAAVSAAEQVVSVRGVVSRVDGRDVVVDVPANHGLSDGDHLAMSRPVEGSDAFFAADPVIAKVVRVMATQVLVRVGMNEVVAVGYVAQVTSERETASRRSPPRVFDVWDLRTVLRPVLNIGSVGGGVSGELGIGRRTEHFRFGVNIAPLAFMGATGKESLFAGGGYVYGAVDHSFYSAGVGVGTNTVNDTDSESEAGSGLTIVQLLRIGAVDGLHLESRVEAVIFRSEVLFGYLQLEGQVAVADSTWLVVRGGGGSIGYAFGEVVVRNLLWGTGQAGSTFMELGLGGAGMFQQSCPETPPVVGIDDIPTCTNTDVGGPMFTAGLHWRL